MPGLSALSTNTPLPQLIAAFNRLLALFNAGGPVDLSLTPTWTGLVYSNTWTDYGGGWSPGAWWKDALGVVHLRGLIARTGAPTNGETIATLPTGARPAGSEVFRVQNATGATRVDVTAAGLVQWQNDGTTGTPGTYLSLSGITFRAA